MYHSAFWCGISLQPVHPVKRVVSLLINSSIVMTAQNVLLKIWYFAGYTLLAVAVLMLLAMNTAL